MKKMIMVKFGGAVLTNKASPCVIRKSVMKQLGAELADFRKKSDTAVLLGNGGGSFGHYYAKKYHIVDKPSGTQALMGMCRGKNGNASLNAELVKVLLNFGIPANTFRIEQFLEKECLEERMLSCLNYHMLPVVYGDFLYQINGSCRIVSTEEIFFRLGEQIANTPSCGYELEKIIFCTDRDGVEDLHGNVIPVIWREDFADWGIFQQPTEGYDVTGGMSEKVWMAFKMDCPVQVINGKKPGRLAQALKNEKTVGTIIQG